MVTARWTDDIAQAPVCLFVSVCVSVCVCLVKARWTEDIAPAPGGCVCMFVYVCMCECVCVCVCRSNGWIACE